MKRDARVFVRCGDTPWISTYCPNCGKRINADDHFCKECGQELSFENYNKVRELCKTLNGLDLHYAIAAFTNNLLDFRKRQKNRPKGIGADHVVAAKENGSL